MPSATFNKFNSFTTNLANGAFNFSSDTIKVMLTLSAPLATHSVKADLTEIATGNGYSAGGNAVVCAGTNVSGTYKAILGDTAFTAAGGSFADFRYAVLYDSTNASKPLIGFYDYGQAITLLDGNSFIVDFDGTNGAFQLVPG